MHKLEIGDYVLVSSRNGRNGTGSWHGIIVDEPMSAFYGISHLDGTGHYIISKEFCYAATDKDVFVAKMRGIQ